MLDPETFLTELYVGSSHETDSQAREAVKVATARPVESLSRPRPPRA